jgi:hypothetical protein
MKRAVFIHTNAKQALGAAVAQYALRRNSRAPERFDVEILSTELFPLIDACDGRTYRFGGGARVWRRDDLQSFTPLRFAPPQRMGYAGRAVVIDPDIFALGDINELLDRDMGNKAIFCRRRPHKRFRPGYFATSVMLLDCDRLRHWDVERDFLSLFEGDRDYKAWMQLGYEPEESIGLFAPEWNDFDRLTGATKLLHTTRRKTQPWKTGLPVDFRINAPLYGFIPRAWIRGVRMAVGAVDRYQPHPDPNQEALFFGLLREGIAAGAIGEDAVRREIELRHVRADAFEVLDRTPPLRQPVIGAAA